MDSWKYLIILKETKKPIGKYLRVLAKDQCRFADLRKFLNLHKKILVET